MTNTIKTSINIFEGTNSFSYYSPSVGTALTTTHPDINMTYFLLSQFNWEMVYKQIIKYSVSRRINKYVKIIQRKKLF